MNANSTRTSLFGIFVLAGRPLSAAQLIALARPFGISSTNVKSHLTRMVTDGTLHRSGPPRSALYKPGEDRREVIQGIGARLLDSPPEPWDGRWLLLTVRLPRGRAERDLLRDALWFDGFRPWNLQTWLRPAWPAEWALGRADAHRAGRSSLCVHGPILGTLNMDQVRRMYELDALDRQARRLARSIEARRDRIRSPAQAFAARLDIGGRVARLVAHDPRLPEMIWGDRTGLHDLLKIYRRFDAEIAGQAQSFLDDVVRS